MRLLCEEKGITLILMKAPSLYPVWYDQWEEQIASYAQENGLLYLNCIKEMDSIGIDYTQDTYDAGLHMNVYGAEKMSRYFGKLLESVEGITDHRDEPELSAVWEEKGRRYDEEKAEQETEFKELGYLTRFAE